MTVVGGKTYDRVYYVDVQPPKELQEEIDKLPLRSVSGVIVGYEKESGHELFRVDVLI